MVNSNYKNSISEIIINISQNVEKYAIEFEMYDFMVKGMRSYKYPLSKLIIKSALSKEIRPVLLQEPKDLKDKQIYIPSAITSIGSADGSFGVVDISPRAKYTRDARGNIESLKIKEVELYTYLQMAYIDAYLKRCAPVIDRSTTLIKNVATAYSRLFTKCIDKTYPIGANIDKYNVSIFLSAVFCIVVMFNRTIEDACNIVFSSGLCNRSEIESDCSLLKEDKLVFTNITEFLEIYNYEFSDYIKEGTLTLRMIVNIYVKMYGANSYFSLEHGATFLNMILSVNIGLYNDKFISKSIKSQVDNINESLVNIFANQK